MSKEHLKAFIRERWSDEDNTGELKDTFWERINNWGKRNEPWSSILITFMGFLIGLYIGLK